MIMNKWYFHQTIFNLILIIFFIFFKIFMFSYLFVIDRVASNRQMSFDVWWFDQIIFDQIFKFWRFGQLFDQIMSNFHQIVKIHQKRKKIIWSKNEILMTWLKQFDEIWRDVIWSNVKFIWCNSKCSKNRFERVMVILQNKRCLSFI